MKIRYRARAIGDLNDIFSYLEPRSPVGAHNVLQAIRAATKDIALFPHAAIQTSDPDIRVKILGRYRYKIFYIVIEPDIVEIIHVRHAARRPWLDKA